METVEKSADFIHEYSCMTEWSKFVGTKGVPNFFIHRMHRGGLRGIFFGFSGLFLFYPACVL